MSALAELLPSAPYRVRAMRPSDLAYVASSWLKHYKDHHHSAPARRRAYLTRRNRRLGAFVLHGYYSEHAPVVNTLLERSRVLVAHYYDATSGPDEALANEDQIWGWVAGERPNAAVWGGVRAPVAIHYVYTKDAFRRLGVAKALVSQLLSELTPPGASLPIVYSHVTANGRDALIHRDLPWHHVPYSAFTAKEPSR